MSSQTALSNNGWIVVADGTGTHLDSTDVDGDSISRSKEKECEPAALLEHGPSSSRAPVQTKQQRDEAAFASRLAHNFDLAAYAGTFEELVVIADPQTSGQLRENFHQAVKERIKAEYPRTRINLLHQNLEDAVARLLA